MIRPKQFSRQGMFYLHEAILDVLLESYPEGYGLGAADISRSAGIYRKPGEIGMNDAIVHGCLNDLHDQTKVVKSKQLNGRGGWKLNVAEYEQRRDDV